MKKLPKEITLCRLECVLMPQGEVISNGKTIGWFKDLKPYLATQQQHDALQAKADCCDDLVKACKGLIIANQYVRDLSLNREESHRGMIWGEARSVLDVAKLKAEQALARAQSG